MQIELSDHLYHLFRDLLLTRCGLYYPERKRGDLAHGLWLALEASGCQSLATLYADALSGGAGWDVLLAQLTIGETYFFRNDAQFDALRQHILPELITRRTALRTMRLWSAGCATGEEPYSLAIVLSELLSHDNTWNVRILGTDINRQFLARANEALYGNWSFRQMPDALRERYWSEQDGRWRLRPDIRRMVNFAQLNLAEPSYPSSANGTSVIDVILCRNVTIYFDEQTTRQVVERFYQALTPGGWLIVGHAEPQAGIYAQFEVHNFPNTVLYRKPLETPNVMADSLIQPFRPHAATAPRSPKPPAVEWERIEALLAQGDALAAETLLVELLAADPTHITALITLGRLYANRGDWTRALRQCQVTLGKNPLSIPAHYLLAQIHEHQNQPEAALAAYRRTVYLDQHFIPGLLGMAKIWQRIGHLASAQRCYRNLLAQLSKLPPITTVSDTDGATVGELIAFVEEQLAGIIPG